MIPIIRVASLSMPQKRRRKIDVIQVEAFKGLMEDVGATHGFLVCPAGHTKAAENRAQEIISLRLLPLERLENFNPASWPQCQNSKCKSGYGFLGLMSGNSPCACGRRTPLRKN